MLKSKTFQTKIVLNGISLVHEYVTLQTKLILILYFCIIPFCTVSVENENLVI